MECPKCGLINPPNAARCDCGFAFVSASSQQASVLIENEPAPAGAPPALPPHRYPAWIWIMGLGIVAALVVALMQLPPYYRAAALVRRAEALAGRGDNNNALALFTEALEITPSSKRIRLGLAMSYFRSPEDEDHKRGLEALQGITLEKDEWEKLSAIMPAAYRNFFTDVRR